MQKSQRYGLAILALLCVISVVAVVWRSRNACERLGYDRPRPSEFTVISAAPPTERSNSHGSSSDSTAANKKHSKKQSSKGKRANGKRGKEKRSKETQQDKNRKKSPDRQWLDEL